MPRHSLSRAQILAVAFITLGNSILASANEFVRPLDPQDYFDYSDNSTLIEHAQRVHGVRVAWVNFEALRRDFPAIADLDDQQIKDWLLQNFSYVGSQQHRLNGLRNSPIPIVAGDTRIAIRPDEWRRSAAMEAIGVNGTPIGMVDIKGIGHGVVSNLETRFVEQLIGFQRAFGQPAVLDRLRIADHSDGLMSLGEAIAEVTRQQATQLLFNESGLGLETVESYAILALPFGILKERGQQIPAALYLRQANLGRHSGLKIPETILTDSHGGRQHTWSRTMVDFGGVVLQDPRIERQFGPYDIHARTNAQTTRPWLWGHETAVAFAQNGDHEAVSRHIEEMLAPLKNDVNIQAAQQRHRLIEQGRLALMHQNRHLSYPERRNVFDRIMWEVMRAQAHEGAPLTVDQARAVLALESTPYLSPEGHRAIQTIISQPTMQAFEVFKDVFFGSSHLSMAAILKRLRGFPEGPFYTQFSQELFDIVNDAYLERNGSAYYYLVRLEAINVVLSLRRHLEHSNQGALLARVDRLLETVSDPHELNAVIQAFKGQSTPLATQMLLRGLQGVPGIRYEALRLAPYNTDPKIVRWIEQNYENQGEVPSELFKAIKETRNLQYFRFLQRRLEYLFTLFSKNNYDIIDLLSVLSEISISQGASSSQELLESMPRISSAELFDALISFRGDITLELLYAIHSQVQASQNPGVVCVLARGMSYLLRGQNHIEALEVIQGLMQSKDHVTATQAVRVLGNYSDLRSAQMLEHKLMHSTDTVTLVAAQTLFERTDSHAVNIRVLALNHENSAIRSMAAKGQAAQYAGHLRSRCNRLLAD